MSFAGPIVRLGSIAILLGLLRTASAQTLQVPVSRFQPTQVEIGKEFALHVFVDRWREQAEAEGLSLEEFAPRLQRAFANTRVPVVIAPDGSILSVDMHHRIFALREVERLTGVHFSLSVEVMHDYRPSALDNRPRGELFSAFARDFVEEQHLGYFGPERSLSPEAKMRLLPANFDELRDNPLRSTVGAVLENEVGINPDNMTTYYEFRVADLLMRQGLVARLRDEGILSATERGVRPGTALSPAMLASVRAAIFQNRNVVDLILQSSPRHIRPGIARIVEREVQASSRRFTQSTVDRQRAFRSSSHGRPRPRLTRGRQVRRIRPR